MIKKFILWIFMLMAGVVLLVFAVANRQLVTVEFFPLPFEIQVPVFLVFLVALVIGILLGAGVACLKHWGWLRAARRHRHEAALLEKEVQILRTEKELAQALPKC